MAKSNPLQDGQVSIRKQYGQYSVEIIFSAEDNHEALSKVKSLIISAYAERVSGTR